MMTGVSSVHGLQNRTLFTQKSLHCRGLPPEKEFLYGQVQNIVVGPETIGTDQGILWIFGPLTVNEELVFVNSWRNYHSLDPRPVLGLLHGVSSGIPLIKIPHEDDLFGIGQIHGERYLALFYSLFWLDL